MEEAMNEISLTLDADALETLRPFIEANASGEPVFLEKNNLGGDAATWIVLATLGVQALPHLVTLLQGLTGRCGSHKIVIGDITIENPTARELELLHTMLAKRAAGEA